MLLYLDVFGEKQRCLQCFVKFFETILLSSLATKALVFVHAFACVRACLRARARAIRYNRKQRSSEQTIERFRDRPGV